MYYTKETVEGLPIAHKIRALKTLWTMLQHQFLYSTVDFDVIVKYVNKVAETVKIPVWEIYGDLYKTGGWDFSAKPQEVSKIGYLKQQGQIRELAAILIKKYDYDRIKAVRSMIRKKAKENVR